MTYQGVQVDSLCKSFKGSKRQITRAVEEVSFMVEPGEFVALVGHNGAGKTTLMKMLATLILPDSGSAMVAGYGLDTPYKIRNKIGFLTPNERSFFWRLSGRQNLAFFGKLIGLSGKKLNHKIDALAEQFNFSSYLDERFDKYSSGMKQNLTFARVLLHEPSVFLLDEPTRSLDAATTLDIQHHLQRLRDAGDYTGLLVTHNMALAHAVCTRCLVMKDGRIIQEQKLDTLPLRTTAYQFETTPLSVRETAGLEAHPAVKRVVSFRENQTGLIITNGSPDHLHAVMSYCVQAGIHLISCTPLEDGAS